MGGSDFDMCLFEGLNSVLNSKVTHQTQDIINNLASTKSEDEFVEYLKSNVGTSFSELCSLASIRQKSEDIKKLLTWNTTVDFSCDALITEVPSHNGLSTIKSQRTQFTVTREYFESTCASLFERSLVPVTRLLTDLDMKKDDIDEVVLVGGSTRIPRVKQQLK